MLSVFLQLWLGETGLRSNLILAALISLAFFVGIFELAFFVLVAVLILNWQPAFSLEILLIALTPLLVFLVRRFLPWQAWLQNLFLAAIGVLVFYFLASPSFFIHNFSLLYKAIFFDIIFAVLVFQVLRYVYKPTA